MFCSYVSAAAAIKKRAIRIGIRRRGRRRFANATMPSNESCNAHTLTNSNDKLTDINNFSKKVIILKNNVETLRKDFESLRVRRERLEEEINNIKKEFFIEKIN